MTSHSAESGALETVVEEFVPFDRMRRRIGEHMLRSRATSPHVHTSMEVDFDTVERLLNSKQVAWRAREGFTLTYLPFIVQALCEAIRGHPRVNALAHDEGLTLHRGVHVAIAVDLAHEGLLTPVVRAAETKSVVNLAQELSSRTLAARDGTLRPGDVTGGTITVTNPGGYGTLFTLPILNQPQVAILSTDCVRKRPWVVADAEGNDVIEIRPIGILTLGWDHRAFDGAYAASFLRAVAHVLETRDWAKELR